MAQAADSDAPITFVVGEEGAGMRLDQYLTAVDQLAAFSRSMLQNIIGQQLVTVDGALTKSGRRLRGGETIAIRLPPPSPTALTPEPVPFTVLHEDGSIIVVSKPPGIVVHPAAGHQHGTLVHGLLYRGALDSMITDQERPGIVHRLDRDTSGVMVIAKTMQSHRRLVEQFKNRQVHKSYRLVVCGLVGEQQGRVIAPIGRHPVHRKKMAVRPRQGRDAETGWQVVARYCCGASQLLAFPKTGRTHQIRVHMTAQGHPLLGDLVYGGKGSASCPAPPRLCLHAETISLLHPETLEPVSYTAPLWPDLARFIDQLESFRINESVTA